MTLNRWLIAGTALNRPYPCRCLERPDWARDLPNWECSAAWCPCSGRSDPQGPACCAWYRTTAVQQAAMQAWRAEKARREAQERD